MYDSTLQSLLLSACLLVSSALVAVAPAWSQGDVRSRHIDVTASDLQMRAKASSGVAVDDAVTLRQGQNEGTIVSPVIEAPFAFNGLAPHWKAEMPDGAVLDVEVRTSKDGTTWTQWTPTGHHEPVEPTIKSTGEPNPHAGDVSAGFVLTEPGSQYAQFRVTLRSGVAAPRMERMSIYVVNSMGGPSEPSEKADAAYNERLKQKSDASTKAVSEPRIYSRSEWGAQAPSGGYSYYTADHLGLHHSASTSEGNADTWSECAAAVRGIQDFHMYTNGWTDIGYNYVICQTGHIFQGREDGNDSSDVVGAHDSANYGSVGVDGMGYFHQPYYQQPTEAMLDAYAELFAWIADRRGIDPSGSSYYYGYGGTVSNVYGHRDVYATACPGDNLYNEIPTIIQRTESILGGGGTGVTLSADWQRNGAIGGRPSWFSSSNSTERGLAYSGGNVYVASRSSGSPKVHVLDAADGSDVTTLSTSGISGGVYAINDVETSSDGDLYAANLTVDASTSAFKVYRWDDASGTPTEVISYSGPAIRLGDHFTVRGSTSDGSIEIWAPAGGGDEVIHFTTSDGGATFNASTINVGSLGTTPSVGAFSQYFFVSSATVGANSYDDDGSLRGSVPSSAIPTTTGGLKTYADFSGSSVRKYAAVFDYVSGSAHGGKLRLVDVTNGASSATLEDDTEWFGGADNPNGTGDVAVKSNGDGTFTIFVLSTNNGLAAFTTGDNKESTSTIASTAPSSWTVGSNYPNPVRAKTSVDVDLPDASTVTMEVYDVLGRRVLTERFGTMNAGRHTLTVQIDDLTSGTYLYRVQAGERTANGTMRVVR